MPDTDNKFTVGLIKSLSFEGDTVSGSIETVDDTIPFIIQGPRQVLEEGKMVKFKIAGTIVQRAIDVENL